MLGHGKIPMALIDVGPIWVGILIRDPSVDILGERLGHGTPPRMAVGKNRVTPKWLALGGNMDQNLRSDSWCFNFDPHPYCAD